LLDTIYLPIAPVALGAPALRTKRAMVRTNMIKRPFLPLNALAKRVNSLLSFFISISLVDYKICYLFTDSACGVGCSGTEDEESDGENHNNQAGFAAVEGA